MIDASSSLDQARWEYLTESETTSVCPYKGIANCETRNLLVQFDINIDFWRDYNVVINGEEHQDLVWWYKYPTAESAPIAGHLCFYNEKVEIFIDGEREKH